MAVALDLQTESWRAIRGHESKYEISDAGRIRSVTRVIVDSKGRKRRLRGRELSATPIDGYLAVNLPVPGGYRKAFVHQLVAETFIGPRPPGQVVNHIDADKSNNCAWNLEWVTPRENALHAARMGCFNTKGERNGFAILTEADVREIRRRRSEGVPAKVLAEQFRVSVPTIYAVASRKTWAQVASGGWGGAYEHRDVGPNRSELEGRCTCRTGSPRDMATSRRMGT